MKYLGVNIIALILLILIKDAWMTTVSIPFFLLMMVIATVVFNGFFLLVFARCEEFKYIWNLLMEKGKGILWRRK